MVNDLRNKFENKWTLRDLDFFPEQIKTLDKSHHFNLEQWYAFEDEHFIFFDTEKEAVEASIKIYETVLKRKIPYSLLERYYRITKK